MTTMSSKIGPCRTGTSKRLTRLGQAGFLFFLAKGVIWLCAPAVLYLVR